MTGSLDFPFIDFHVHLFPDNFFDAVWKALDQHYGWKVQYRLYTPQAIDFLRAKGASHIVYSNYAHKPGVADFLNAWNLELLEQHDFLYCFGAFHPEPDDSKDRLRRLLDHPRVLGIKLQILVQRIPVDHEGLFEIYEALIESGKRLLIHIGTGPSTHEFLGYRHFERLMHRYPELKVTVPHLGGSEFAPFREMLDDFPDMMLDSTFTFVPYEGMRCPWSDEELLRYQDRLLYGSDFPNIIFPWDTEIKTILSRNLGDAFNRKIFLENGMKILGGSDS